MVLLSTILCLTVPQREASNEKRCFVALLYNDSLFPANYVGQVQKDNNVLLHVLDIEKKSQKKKF